METNKQVVERLMKENAELRQGLALTKYFVELLFKFRQFVFDHCQCQHEERRRLMARDTDRYQLMLEVTSRKKNIHLIEKSLNNTGNKRMTNKSWKEVRGVRRKYEEIRQETLEVSPKRPDKNESQKQLVEEPVKAVERNSPKDERSLNAQETGANFIKFVANNPVNLGPLVIVQTPTGGRMTFQRILQQPTNLNTPVSTTTIDKVIESSETPQRCEEIRPDTPEDESDTPKDLPEDEPDTTDVLNKPEMNERDEALEKLRRKLFPHLYYKAKQKTSTNKVTSKEDIELEINEEVCDNFQIPSSSLWYFEANQVQFFLTKTSAFPYFYCCLCGNRFDKFDRFEEHYNYQHYNQKRGFFECTEKGCSKMFRKSEWTEHVKQEHDGIFRCNVGDCKFENENFDQFYTHFFCHRKMLSCPREDCSYKTRSKSDLQSHLDWHDNKITFSCSYPGCDYQGISNLKLKAHEVVHKVATVSCTWSGCKLKFKSNSLMEKHIKLTHKKIRDFPCDWPGCDFEARDAKQWRQHTKTHIKCRFFPCPWSDCDKTFQLKAHFDCHMLTHTGEEPFKCDFEGCHKKFTSKSNLSNHLRTHNRKIIEK